MTLRELKRWEFKDSTRARGGRCTGKRLLLECWALGLLLLVVSLPAWRRSRALGLVVLALRTGLWGPELGLGGYLVHGELLLGQMCWRRKTTERVAFLVMLGHRGGREGLWEVDDAWSPLLVGEFWWDGRVRDAGRHSSEAANRCPQLRRKRRSCAATGRDNKAKVRGGLRFKLRGNKKPPAAIYKRGLPSHPTPLALHTASELLHTHQTSTLACVSRL